MRCTLPLYGTPALCPPVVLEHPLGWLKTRQKHQYGGFNKRTHPTKTIHFSCTSCILWFKKAPKGWAENPPKTLKWWVQRTIYKKPSRLSSFPFVYVTPSQGGLTAML